MTDKGTQNEPPQSNDAQMTDGAPQKIKKARKAKLDRKDSQLIIRVKGSDRDAFVDLCEALETSAAREIRRFMREFTLLHSGAAGSSAGSTAAPETTTKEEPKSDGKSKPKSAEKRS